MNDKHEVLVVVGIPLLSCDLPEKFADGPMLWKLPGGLVDPGE